MTVKLYVNGVEAGAASSALACDRRAAHHWRRHRRGLHRRDGRAARLQDRPARADADGHGQCGRPAEQARRHFQTRPRSRGGGANVIGFIISKLEPLDRRHHRPLHAPADRRDHAHGGEVQLSQQVGARQQRCSSSASATCTRICGRSPRSPASRRRRSAISSARRSAGCSTRAFRSSTSGAGAGRHALSSEAVEAMRAAVDAVVVI